jgi:beta-alanine--pyruvate transaminase
MKYAANSLEYCWMPFTSNRDFKESPRLLVKGEGVHYWSHTGERILDGSSGLFCCALGHGRREIADAVHAQLLELDYGPPFQLGHPAQFELARRVAQLLPEGIERVFFVNSGSEAVDTALKVALAYHRARGEGTRMRFISRERAYHGVNIGGTSLSGLVKNREAFGVGMAGVAHLRHTWLPENRFAKGRPEHGGPALADDLERMVALYGADTIAACFVEPIAGSTGTLVPPVGYLERLREICDRHGILLVFDEVITGFGRTGKAFAAQSFGVRPDIVTMAKALTNGAQPMGAVGVDERIYETLCQAAPEGAIEFLHGYTYSGHPGACAAGLAVMDLYEQEDVFARAEALSPYFLDAVFSLSDLPLVTDLRGYGMIAGLDLEPGATPGARGLDFQKRLFAAGLHIKMTGDSGIIAPPLICEREHVDQLVEIMRQVLGSY